jgi:AcrR family transcriptional regulator
MHQIAVAAGVGQGTLYRRYASKGALCLDLMLERYERFGEEITALLAQTATAPALERLDRVLARMVLWLEEQGTMRTLGGVRGIVAGPERRKERAEGPCNEVDLSQHTAYQTTPWYRWLHDLLTGLFTEAVARGARRAGYPLYRRCHTRRAASRRVSLPTARAWLFFRADCARVAPHLHRRRQSAARCGRKSSRTTYYLSIFLTHALSGETRRAHA